MQVFISNRVLQTNNPALHPALQHMLLPCNWDWEYIKKNYRKFNNCNIIIIMVDYYLKANNAGIRSFLIFYYHH